MNRYLLFQFQSKILIFAFFAFCVLMQKNGLAQQDTMRVGRITQPPPQPPIMQFPVLMRNRDEPLGCLGPGKRKRYVLPEQRKICFTTKFPFIHFGRRRKFR